MCYIQKNNILCYFSNLVCGVKFLQYAWLNYYTEHQILCFYNKCILTGQLNKNIWALYFKINIKLASGSQLSSQLAPANNIFQICYYNFVVHNYLLANILFNFKLKLWTFFMLCQYSILGTFNFCFTEEKNTVLKGGVFPPLYHILMNMEIDVPHKQAGTHRSNVTLSEDQQRAVHSCSYNNLNLFECSRDHLRHLWNTIQQALQNT